MMHSADSTPYWTACRLGAPETFQAVRPAAVASRATTAMVSPACMWASSSG